uniref:Uncharacterized protein n=1 Tax=Panagrellus redivivus TaxID=6233 RepID=A0A7E4ZQU6_PANRE
MAAAATSWIRRLSTDQQQGQTKSRRISLCIPSSEDTHSLMPTSTSPRSTECRPVRRRGPINFIAGLYASSRRRLSLPVSSLSCELGPENLSTAEKGHPETVPEEVVPPTAPEWRIPARNRSLPDVIERTAELPKSPRGNIAMNVPDSARRVTVVDRPGQDKAHFTGLKGKAKKPTRKLND